MGSRARFTPAVDSNGNPAPSRVEQEVDWTLPIARVSNAPNSGPGMMVSVSPPPIVFEGPRIAHPPAVAIPQDGPGEADLSVWDSQNDSIVNLGRYESIPACRKVKAQLRLRPDQRAWCTVAEERHRGLDPNWNPPH
jgi:hypothetical protein